MAGSRGAGMRWLKYGCFGCLGLVGIVALLSAGVTGLAWLRAQGERIETHASTRELPTAGEPAGPPAASGPPESSTQALPASRGTVVLDLAHADFEIRPAEAGQPLRVEATYDVKAYELKESLEEDSGAGAWTYRLSFRATKSSLLTSLKQAFSGSTAEVRILLPAAVPMSLELGISEGNSSVELGGLQLSSAELEVEKGNFELEIGEPLATALERLSVRTTMGNAQLRSLGNASPRVLRVHSTMGNAEIDLRGEWAADAEVEVSSRMGNAELRLPRNVRVIGLEDRRSRVVPPDESEITRPTLTVHASSSMGNLEVFE